MPDLAPTLLPARVAKNRVRKGASEPQICNVCPDSPTIIEEEAAKMFTITGTVAAPGKYLVTGMPFNTQSHTPLRLAFENNTAGTNLALCAGSDADFNAGQPGMRLSDSGGPGFKFLTILDASVLSGKVIYVLREVGTAPSQFTLMMD
jgi:hypothetical protein